MSNDTITREDKHEVGERNHLLTPTPKRPQVVHPCTPALLRKRPIPTPGYQLELLDDEILLFHPASLTIMLSNESGALIWQLCNGQRTVGDIVALLQAAYPESAAAIERDVTEILQTWLQNGAIQWQ